MSQDQKEIIHLGISYADNFPDVIIENFINDIKTEGLIVKTTKRESLVLLAAIEWLWPTTIAAYIFKPYFESFLKEMGKDHYILLKDWLKKLVKGHKLIKITTLTATQSFLKEIGKDSQSKSISIYFQTIDDKKIKLLFDNELEEKNWENAIDEMLRYMTQNYENYPNDELTLKLKDIEQEIYFEYYAVINKETKRLVFVNTRGVLNFNKDKKEEIK